MRLLGAFFIALGGAIFGGWVVWTAWTEALENLRRDVQRWETSTTAQTDWLGMLR